MLSNLSKIMVVALLLFPSCGQELLESPTQNTSTAQGLTTLPPDLQVQVDVASSGSSLTASITKYTLDLDDCASGYSATVTELELDLEVYRGDENCLAKLVGFTLDGSTYTAKLGVGNEFDNYLPGDTAIFEDGMGGEVIAKVEEQLSSPVKEFDNVSYTIMDINQGITQSFMQMTIGAPGNMPEPMFNLVSASWVGVDTFNEALQYQFKLECKSPLKSSDTECEGFLLDGLRYRLVPDIYGGTPDLMDLQNLFPPMPDPDEHAVDPMDVIGVGQQGLANGGFFTSGGPDVLQSPADVALPGNADLIFVLEIEDGLDYIYWTFDIDTGHIVP